MPTMRSHNLRIVAIFFWSLWFGLIVPGHQRGVVALPGSERAIACDTTWAMSDGSGCCKTKSSAPGKGDPVRHCAICKLVATLDVPTTINHDAPPLALLPEAVTVRPTRVHCALTVNVERGRAPPVAI